MGTIVDRPLTRGPVQIKMSVHGAYGTVSLRSVASTTVKANLVCAAQPAGLACAGIATVGPRHVLIATLGSPDHGTVLIRLSGAVSPRSAFGVQSRQPIA
jgi:hypothetical protein